MRWLAFALLVSLSVPSFGNSIADWETWATQCMRDNPMNEGLIDPESWDRSCLDGMEPCTLLTLDRENMDRTGRCSYLLDQWDAARAEVESLPARPEVSRNKSLDGRTKQVIGKAIDFVRNEPDQYVLLFSRIEQFRKRTHGTWPFYEEARGRGGSQDREAIPKMAFNVVIYERNSRYFNNTAYRNADHYLWAYSQTLNADYAAIPWSVVTCGLALGYGGLKALLGPARNLLGEASKPVSEASWDQVYWGCAGASDALSGTFGSISD